MDSQETLVLTRKQVANLLSIDECIAAVEQAFRMYANKDAQPPGILGLHTSDGGFHIKAGILNLNKIYFVAKTNANFPQNSKRNGLPTIQGVVAVCDGENGRLLALMDSIEITIARTGAATAVAAKYLAKVDAKSATICGCGNQGKISLRAIMRVCALQNVHAYDIDFAIAKKFATELTDELNIAVVAVDDLSKAVKQSDICITCTPSKQPILKLSDVSPGTFVAAVGADSEDKRELDTDLMTSSKVVVDLIDQCSTIGELHHVLKQGKMNRTDICAELGEIIAGHKPGRTSSDEIIIFDSTGMALQDVAAAAIVYEKALATGAGTKVNFAQ